MEDNVTRLVEPVARGRGLDLVDVEFLPAGRRSILRVTLDREGGVGLDDLAEASREMSDLLDVHDAVPGNYTLECSSPGVNRPLRRPEDFARFVGKPVRVRTTAPIGGARSFKGCLVDASTDRIEIEDASRGRVVIPLSDVERANYEYEFATGRRPGRA
ncbi:MAG: ribosome maturation factor RimP [Alphaproteobacteria bacterium]